MPEGIVSAHGLGGQSDLPIPLELAVTGAVAALVVSFTVLAVAWRTPRFDTAEGRPAPAWLAGVDQVVRAPWFRFTLRLLGFVLFLYAASAAVFGQDLLTNPVFGIFYVWWWVGLVPLSFLFGPVWKAISPARTINLLFAKLSGSDPARGLFDYPARLGYWPAVLGLYAFVWMELVYPHLTELGPVRLWCAAYVGIMLIGGALFGDGFYERADPFEVYSALIGKLSPFAVRDGRMRSPLANLAAAEVRPGLVAVVGVLFGSTAFDSFRESEFWVKTYQNSEVSAYLLNNLALLAFSAGATLIFVVGCMLTGVGPEQRRRELPNLLAHSLVPIVLGYIVAHYLTYLYEVGQQTLINASDPYGLGWDILGTGDWSIDYWFSYHATFLASLKVLAVILGHVVGAVAAHDRAIVLLPRRHQLTGQLSLLAAMVTFTAGGLYLLFAA